LELEIRPAFSSADYDQVAKFYRAYLNWQTNTYHDVVFLLEDFFAAIESDIASLPGVYAPPAGCLLLAWIDGVAAGTGALKDHGNGTCELMRMYVASEVYGRGIGRALGDRLLDEARALGYGRIVLVTGPRQYAAQKLYTSLGFQEIAPFNDNEIPPEVIAQLPEDLQRGVISMERWL
jgi:GNAT superfamily N-acetyltransferase